MGITSWFIKNKTKEVIKGILEGIKEFWNDIRIKMPEPDNYTGNSHENDRIPSKPSNDDPTDVMRGY